MRTLIAAVCSVLVTGALAVSVRADDAKKAKDEKPAAEAAAPAEKTDKAAPAAEAGDKAGPETLKFEKTGKMAPVAFPHRKHQDKLKGCKDCHEGEKPLFAKTHEDKGITMKDMYAGQACGACHDGKKAFAAKTGCMKCHKKEAK